MENPTKILLKVEIDEAQSAWNEIISCRVHSSSCFIKDREFASKMVKDLKKFLDKFQRKVNNAEEFSVNDLRVIGKLFELYQDERYCKLIEIEQKEASSK